MITILSIIFFDFLTIYFTIPLQSHTVGGPPKGMGYKGGDCSTTSIYIISSLRPLPEFCILSGPLDEIM